MYFVLDNETANNRFHDREDAEAFALRRGGLVVKLVGEVEAPEVEQNQWSDADRKRYEREKAQGAAAWARTNNED